MIKWQAGLSVGMSKIQTLRHVILPQAYRIVIPSWTNEFCSLTKSTATLAFRRLTRLSQAQVYQSKCSTMQILPVWIVIGLIYLVWITGFSKIMDIIYEKKKIPGVELADAVNAYALIFLISHAMFLPKVIHSFESFLIFLHVALS